MGSLDAGAVGFGGEDGVGFMGGGVEEVAVAGGWGGDDEFLGPVFAVSWRSSLSTLDVSGVTFCGDFVEGFVSGFGVSDFGDGGVEEEHFGADFRVAAGLASSSGVGLVDREAFDALVVALAVLGSAFVEFALVVVFFPLFFSTPIDMLCDELVAPRCE